MKIHPSFAAIKRSVFRRVNEDTQTVFELTRRGEINEPAVAGVIAADGSDDSAGSSSQTKVGGAIDFHVEIRIADDELKRRVVWSAREKFLRRGCALGIREIQCELPIFSEIVNRARCATDGPELLILLTRRRERSLLRIARPTEFTSTPGSGYMLQSWERQNKN